MKNLAILGAGGHGKVAADTAEQLGWTIHFFDGAYPEVKTCGVWNVVGNYNCLIDHASKYDAVFVAIGDNKVREIKLVHLKNLGFKITSLILDSSKYSSKSRFKTNSTRVPRVIISSFASCVKIV